MRIKQNYMLIDFNYLPEFNAMIAKDHFWGSIKHSSQPHFVTCKLDKNPREY